MSFRFNYKLLGRWALFTLILLVFYSVGWTNQMFGSISLDEVLLFFRDGVGGIDAGLVCDFVKHVVLWAIGWSVVLMMVCYFFRKYKYVPLVIYLLLFVLMVLRLCVADVRMGSLVVGDKSRFYEKYYVAPETAQIAFPEKRNVLMIVLESIEKQYANENLFGYGGLTPNITKLEQENVSFENYHALSGFSFTIAAIVGMTTGLPLYYTGPRVKEKMLGATGLGNILLKNGYQTWALFPASGKFSLKENFLRRIGFKNVYDGEKFRSMLRGRHDVNPFDGIDDASLFEASKPLISRIIHSEMPYFIFMETINTHLKGYKTRACHDMGFEQETQADIVKCEDKIVYDFVSWFMKQDPDAAVILINDHNQRAGDTIDKIPQTENRNLVNVFANTSVFDGTDLNRPVAVMDFFPTIIEVAGGEIRGCRLGLGTALTTRCAKTRTLREKFGDTELEMLMEQENDLYHRLSSGTDKSK